MRLRTSKWLASIGASTATQPLDKTSSFRSVDSPPADCFVVSSFSSFFKYSVHRRERSRLWEEKTLGRVAERFIEMAHYDQRCFGRQGHSFELIWGIIQYAGDAEYTVRKFHCQHFLRNLLTSKGKSMPFTGNNHQKAARETLSMSILVSFWRSLSTLTPKTDYESTGKTSLLNMIATSH